MSGSSGEVVFLFNVLAMLNCSVLYIGGRFISVGVSESPSLSQYTLTDIFLGVRPRFVTLQTFLRLVELLRFVLGVLNIEPFEWGL